MRTSVKTFVGFVSLTIIFIFAYTVLISGPAGMQSDEAMKILFMKHRDSFTKLERLFMEDPTLFYVSESGLFRKDGNGAISKSQITDEFWSVFKQNGILSGTRDTVLDRTFLAFPTSMTLLDRTDPNESFFEEKGYALFFGPDEKIQQLLGTKGLLGNVKFRQIEDRWYIYNRVVVSKPE